MFDRQFFKTRLGLATVVSIAAMVSFNLLALSQQMQAHPVTQIAAASIVELA